MKEPDNFGVVATTALALAIFIVAYIGIDCIRTIADHMNSLDQRVKTIEEKQTVTP